MEKNLVRGYSLNLNKVGFIVSADFENNTVTLKDNDGVRHVEDFESVLELAYIGNLKNGKAVYDSDVLVNKENSEMFEVEYDEDDESYYFYQLDNKYNRVHEDKRLCSSGLHVLKDSIDVIDSVYVLLSTVASKVDFDFNIKLYKQLMTNGKTEYLYACNNKKSKEIDLIKVVFVGHHLMEEEDYERFTLSYEEFEEVVNDGTIEESTPYELIAYINNKPSVPTDDYDEEDYDDEYEEDSSYSPWDDEDDEEEEVSFYSYDDEDDEEEVKKVEVDIEYCIFCDETVDKCICKDMM